MLLARWPLSILPRRSLTAVASWRPRPEPGTGTRSIGSVVRARSSWPTSRSTGRSEAPTRSVFATIVTSRPTSSTATSERSGRWDTVAGDSASTTVPRVNSTALISTTRVVNESPCVVVMSDTLVESLARVHGAASTAPMWGPAPMSHEVGLRDTGVAGPPPRLVAVGVAAPAEGES